MLGLSITSHTISYYKDAMFKKHPMIVKLRLLENTNNVIILNINDYHNIHIKKIPNTVTTLTAAHLITVLLNLIENELAILK